MDGRNQKRIRIHLEDLTVQERILQNIQRGRGDLTVTIGRASELSGFSISQLRDWEKKGLLRPFRPESSDARGATGQRQYPISELDKLAIIRELINTGFSPSAIPANIDEIWASIIRSSSTSEDTISGEKPKVDTFQADNHEKFLPIRKRVDIAYLENFYWRFYASHALLLALMLVTEDVSGTYSGLILPLKKRQANDPLPNSYKLAEIGESLVGWLGQTRSFSTLFVPAPSFEYPSDFHVLPLSVDGEYERQIEEEEDRTLIFVQREEVNKLNLTKDVVETAKSLLKPLYEDSQDWWKYFGEGMKDLVSPGVNFTPRLHDTVLTGMANMVVRLGGKRENGENRWRFCYILLPEDLQLPLQQRKLVVRAMSEDVHYTIGVTTLPPERYRTSLSIRAFQGGHIMYRQELSERDTTQEVREIEGPVRSNIAVPIGGEIGEPLGVIHVASYESNAFSERDCRVLRMIARMIEELLRNYTTQRQLARNLAELVKEPETVDPSFKDFWSENDFIFDIEKHLEQVLLQMTYEKETETKISTFSGRLPMTGEIAFIALDIDDQDRVVREYDEGTLRNLQKTIGQRIRDLLPALFTRYVDCKLYHIYAGRFYLFLRNFSLDVSKRNAERLKRALEGNIAIKLPDMLGRTIIIQNVSLHLAVGWYSYEKLKEFLEIEQYHAVADVSATIYRSLDSVLKLGMDDGGDVIYAWDPGTESFSAYGSDDSIK
jgi:MerR HTH family regulatory protein/GAF domain